MNCSDLSPINVEVQRCARNCEELVKLVERRLHIQSAVSTALSADEHSQLVSVLLSEVHNAWPDIKSLANDPALSPSDNKELRRRITVHIVAVCQTLLQYYIHKTHVLNSRGVFSADANMSRLKTQLALDANKFLNVLVIRRYILADLVRTQAPPTTVTPPIQGNKVPRLPSHQHLIELIHYTQSNNDEQAHSIKRDLSQLLCLPGLDMNTVADIVLSLPTLSNNNSDPAVSHTNSNKLSQQLPADQHRKSSEADSREKVILKRSRSVSDLLSTTDDSSCDLSAPSHHKQRLVSATTARCTGTHTQLHCDNTQVDSRSDLQRLVATAHWTTTTTTTTTHDDDDDDDELAPLLQATMGCDDHDARIRQLTAELERLEEREIQRQEAERIVVARPVHTQPHTDTTHLSHDVSRKRELL